MSRQITITAGGVQVRAKLDDTPTGEAIAAALPVEGQANRWGGEVYFAIPVDVDLEVDAREVLEAGELAYWPPGKMFCVFFGTTPASKGEEIRAASAVNVFGRVRGELDGLWSVPDGALVSVALTSECG
ncbi:MAG: cyclophilin-like fold protein [Planctomycetota bacterium]|jgi:hypothetical protein